MKLASELDNGSHRKLSQIRIQTGLDQGHQPVQLTVEVPSEWERYLAEKGDGLIRVLSKAEAAGQLQAGLPTAESEAFIFGCAAEVVGVRGAEDRDLALGADDLFDQLRREERREISWADRLPSAWVERSRSPPRASPTP